MNESKFSFTQLAGGEIRTLNFSGNLPHFSLQYIQPTEQIRQPEEIAKLEAELGNSAVKLHQQETQIQALQKQVAALESLGAPAVVGQVELDTPRIPAQIEVGLGKIKSIVATPEAGTLDPAKQDSSHERQLVEHAPNPELTPMNQRAEEAILYLLQMPDLKVASPNAGGQMRNALSIEKISDWRNTKAKLESLGIITSTTSPTHSKRLSEISLDLEGLVASVTRPFVTPRVLEALKESTTSSGEREVGENNVATKDTAVTPQQNEHDSTASSHQMSPRVRKMLADETTSNNAPYRDRGKGARKLNEKAKPFLEHRRQPTGAKSRR
jgi:hypothetical protein